MTPLVNVTAIDAWDYERMKSYTYMKEGGSTRGASFWVLSKRKKKLSFLCFSDWFCFVVGDMCISVLNRLQYLVALEGRMLKGVNGFISKG
jgi:hypothetical protein